MFYCTLTEAKAELKATTPGNAQFAAAQDERLLRHIRQVTDRVNLIMTGHSRRQHFWPTIETRQTLIDAAHVNSRMNTFLLDQNSPLLGITTVTANGTAITSAAEGFPQGVSPIRTLRITSSGDYWYSYLTCADPGYVSIAGVWGYHSDYANAWMQADTLSAAITTTTETTFTVSNIDSSDLFGFSGRISAGSLVKIDSEYMLVTGVDISTNVATVRRGQQGSTAATHLVSAPVYTWQTEEPISRVVARQSGLLYAREGAYQVEILDGVGTISYPQDLLAELKATLMSYINGY